MNNSREWNSTTLSSKSSPLKGEIVVRPIPTLEVGDDLQRDTLGQAVRRGPCDSVVNTIPNFKDSAGIGRNFLKLLLDAWVVMTTRREISRSSERISLPLSTGSHFGAPLLNFSIRREVKRRYSLISPFIDQSTYASIASCPKAVNLDRLQTPPFLGILQPGPVVPTPVHAATTAHMLLFLKEERRKSLIVIFLRPSKTEKLSIGVPSWDSVLSDRGILPC
jgi:hypothetical protein